MTTSKSQAGSTDHQRGLRPLLTPISIRATHRRGAGSVIYRLPFGLSLAYLRIALSVPRAMPVMTSDHRPPKEDPISFAKDMARGWLQMERSNVWFWVTPVIVVLALIIFVRWVFGL
jgi:hypothetical protein